VRLLADENLHPRIAARLAADGHDLAHVSDIAPSLSDREVLALAVAQDALLVTNDLDFGTLVSARCHTTSSVVGGAVR
jgi:predicted nuclease of predicted toxin-antitoxin system